MTETFAPGIPKEVYTLDGLRHLLPRLGRPLRSPAVAIGNFDGVHKGHQALLREAVSQAKRLGGESVALTFHPHPARFFAPDLAPPMLTSPARKAELLHSHGIDIVLVEPFDAAFAARSAEDFVDEILGRTMGTKHVVVGADFSFGQGRRGNARFLGQRCPELGMGLTVVEQVLEEGLVCSSTKIREFILEGCVEGATLLLGRPFELEGRIVGGFQRGRTLGFPTANLELQAGVILPRMGVYAGYATVLGPDGGAHRAAISVGTNPTFAAKGDPEMLCEAHLLDFSGDLYGKPLRLSFVAKLRDQRRFPTVDELTAAIRQDLDRTRKLLP